MGASWRYLYKSGSSFLNRRSNDEGALHGKSRKELMHSYIKRFSSTILIADYWTFNTKLREMSLEN
jgi:hypothetical protein